MEMPWNPHGIPIEPLRNSHRILMESPSYCFLLYKGLTLIKKILKKTQIRYSLAGQDTRPSPERPGFESRWRNFLLFSKITESVNGESNPLQESTTPRGFEPLRAEPNGFRVHLLNRSDTVSLVFSKLQKRLYSEALSNHRGHQPFIKHWRFFFL